MQTIGLEMPEILRICSSFPRKSSFEILHETQMFPVFVFFANVQLSRCCWRLTAREILA